MNPYIVPINNIEGTYDALFSLTRKVDEKQPNGSTKLVDKVIYTNVKCGIYMHRAEEYDTRRTVQAETGDFRLFTSLDSFIYKGDVITFTQYGRTYTAITGDPIAYETHQEVVMHQVELARRP